MKYSKTTTGLVDKSLKVVLYPLLQNPGKPSKHTLNKKHKQTNMKINKTNWLQMYLNNINF